MAKTHFFSRHPQQFLRVDVTSNQGGQGQITAIRMIWRGIQGAGVGSAQIDVPNPIGKRCTVVFDVQEDAANLTVTFNDSNGELPIHDDPGNNNPVTLVSGTNRKFIYIR